MCIKWPFFTHQAGLEGSGKNPKSGFFLLGLKYTLRTCFGSKNFFVEFLSWAEKSAASIFS
jgi:hypothetical protein